MNGITYFWNEAAAWRRKQLEAENVHPLEMYPDGFGIWVSILLISMTSGV